MFVFPYSRCSSSGSSFPPFFSKSFFPMMDPMAPPMITPAISLSIRPRFFFRSRRKGHIKTVYLDMEGVGRATRCGKLRMKNGEWKISITFHFQFSIINFMILLFVEPSPVYVLTQCPPPTFFATPFNSSNVSVAFTEATGRLTRSVISSFACGMVVSAAITFSSSSEAG